MSEEIPFFDASKAFCEESTRLLKGNKLEVEKITTTSAEFAQPAADKKIECPKATS
jgi:hypothetical protein